MVATARQARRWLAGGPVLLRDRVLVGMLAWTALAGVLFVALAGHTDQQVRVFWSFQPPLDAVLAVSSWRVHRIAAGANRRFWLVLAVVGALFLAGDVYQAVLTFVSRQPLSPNGGAVQSAGGTLSPAGVPVVARKADVPRTGQLVEVDPRRA